MRPVSEVLSAFWVRWRFGLLAAATVLAAAASFSAGRLDFNRSIESVFAPDDPRLAVYRKLRRTFDGNEIVMAVYDDPQLLDPGGAGIRRLAQTSRQLAELAGVDFTLSLDQPMGEGIVDPASDLARRGREVLQGYTHGADGHTAAVVCVLLPQPETPVPRAQTIAQIREVIRRRPSGMITGEPVMVVDGFRYIETDGRRLGWATTGLLSLVILVCFRSIRWVLIPLAVVQWATLLTRAVLVWSGLELTMVSSMFTAIITVIGVASVVHIMVRFREARVEGRSPQEALQQAGRRVAAPIAWAALTDAAAFCALMLSRVGPVRDFGLMMALGATTVLVAIALIVPGLALLGRTDVDVKRAWGEDQLGRWLDRLVLWGRRRPVAVGLTAVGVAAFCCLGAGHAEVETDFTRNFRAATPLVRAYQYVEKHLGGAGVWDVVVPAPQTLDWPFLRRVLHLEARLRDEVTVPGAAGREEAGLTKVLSLADVLVAGSPMDLDRIRIARLQSAVLHAGIERLTRQMPGLVKLLHGEDRDDPGQYYLRIMLRARERQAAAAKERIIQQVEAIVRQEFPPGEDGQGGEVGGFFVLLTRLVRTVLRDQWLTFAAATAAIGLMMILALGSVRLALIALVPNGLPVLAVVGLLGWAGTLAPEVKINMGAAMIAAVSIGLSIDSSIHYLFAVRQARREGRRLEEAIGQVQQGVGRAVVFSTAALVAGFGILATSQFVPTAYFGVLVSLTMLGGLAGNLLVLPLLLHMAAA